MITRKEAFAHSLSRPKGPICPNSEHFPDGEDGKGSREEVDFHGGGPFETGLCRRVSEGRGWSGAHLLGRVGGAFGRGSLERVLGQTRGLLLAGPS